MGPLGPLTGSSGHLEGNDMKTTKQEKRAILVIALAAFVALAFWGGASLFSNWRDQAIGSRDSEFVESARQTYAMDEFVPFDSDRDKEQSGELPSGLSFTPVADEWNGCLDIRVDDARLLSTEEASQYVNEDVFPYWKDDANAERFLVCTVTLRNASAEPLSRTQGGLQLFNIGFLCLENTGNGPVAFSGTADVAQDDESAGFYFDLPVGQTKTFIIVYGVPESVDVNTLSLQVGGGYGDAKYVFDLAIDE